MNCIQVYSQLSQGKSLNLNGLKKKNPLITRHGTVSQKALEGGQNSRSTYNSYDFGEITLNCIRFRWFRRNLWFFFLLDYLNDVFLLKTLLDFGNLEMSQNEINQKSEAIKYFFLLHTRYWTSNLKRINTLKNVKEISRSFFWTI